MGVQQFQMMSTIAFICMGVFLVIAAILFFVFDIPALIGELSGKTAAKQVAQIRERNKRPASRQTAINGYEKMLANSARTTEKVKTESKQVVPKWSNPLLNESVESTALLNESVEGTALLDEGTALLDEGTVLLSDETELLEEEGTVLLSEDRTSNTNFIITQNIVVTHTNEKI